MSTKIRHWLICMLAKYSGAARPKMCDYKWRGVWWIERLNLPLMNCWGSFSQQTLQNKGSFPSTFTCVMECNDTFIYIYIYIYISLMFWIWRLPLILLKDFYISHGLHELGCLWLWTLMSSGSFLSPWGCYECRLDFLSALNLSNQSQTPFHFCSPISCFMKGLINKAAQHNATRIVLYRCS